ncbi:hypothetical protein JMM81_20725 [Bacillus sp. V3B]|uniref:hypothetical protein n=1 Tax=Bacillus sp. V3B TaxID=2804915 RepID=UPI00210B1E5E|nr:hypothetical protein [Bacillus sp. V3B]MCQ6277301.1 hypothetical protein [Bacillus sp. V3B]
MPKDNNEILKRIQALNEEREVNAINKRLVELQNQLYEMDIESMEYEIKRGFRTHEEAEKELARRRKDYFGTG